MKINMHTKNLHQFSSTLILILSLNTIILIKPSNSALETFIYSGCSQLKYNPSSPYESNVNSVLASLVNSASFSNFNQFKISLTQNDTVYGLYQCRGDLSSPDCHECVVHAVARLGTICGGASGGALQLEGCLVRYDHVSFLGVEDKSVVLDKCGPSIGYDSDLFSKRDAVLAYLTGGGEFYRAGGSGEVRGVVQCVQDLSVGECQDCLLEAIRRLKSECGGSAWGDMFLGKCYARYAERGYTSETGNGDDDTEKTLAIIIGLVAGVAILIVFFSYLSKLFDRKGGK